MLQKTIYFLRVFIFLSLGAIVIPISSGVAQLASNDNTNQYIFSPMKTDVLFAGDVNNTETLIESSRVIHNKASLALAATTVKVTDVITQGWVYIDEANTFPPPILPYKFVDGPGTPPNLYGSHQFNHENTVQGQLLAANILTGTKVSDITSLSFTTWHSNSTSNDLSISIGVQLTNSVNASFARIVFVPKTANIAQNTWQTWNALNSADGDWYTSSFVTGSPCPVPSGPVCTLASLLAAYPDAQVDTRSVFGISTGFVGVKQSAGSATAFVDSFTVGTASATTTYNFEPERRVFNLTHPAAYYDIQPAINAATAGDVISITAGIYTGTNNVVTINKNNLTLIGAGAANTIIRRTATGPVTGIAIANNVTGTTIKDLRVEGFDQGGICGLLGNSNTTVMGTQVYSNTTGSSCQGGIHFNGPLDNVTINNNEAFYNTSRGIVIWNGLKTHITITNNTVKYNNCCGIELQDGSASGVLIENNLVENNSDSGIGVLGLTSGAGENRIQNNIIRNNGRFGIEIKVPNGTGAESGDGAILVLTNTVELTTAIGTLKPGEVRDLAGIAAFRRAFSAANGNADIPNGVVIKGNTVSGYQQPSTSDGFGIVVEGNKMTVRDNTLNNNDVGVQIQGGHTPYAANVSSDGDQSNLADQFFGRGNAPVGCAAITLNTFSGNTTLTRTVGTGSVPRVKNLNTNVSYCTIQTAIDDATTLAGHVISISTGTFSENVVLSKSLVLMGNGNASTIIQSATANTPAIKITASGVDASNRIMVSNLKVTGATGGANDGAGILIAGNVDSRYMTFANLVSSQNQGAGIAFNTTPGVVSDIIITNTTLSTNGNAGLRIASAVSAFDGLHVSNSTITTNATHGFDYNPSGTNTNNGTNFHFTNTTFTSNNTSGTSNSHDMSFFRFNGNASLTDVSVVSGMAANKAHGIVFNGSTPTAAAGNIVLNRVTMNGAVGKSAIYILNYNNISGVSMTDVDIRNVTAQASWPQMTLDHTGTTNLAMGNTKLRTLGVFNAGWVDARSAAFYHATTGDLLNKCSITDQAQIEQQIGHKADLTSLGLAIWYNCAPATPATATELKVTEVVTRGWVFLNDSTSTIIPYEFVEGPGTPTYPTGSHRFDLTNVAQGELLAANVATGTKLSELAALNFTTWHSNTATDFAINVGVQLTNNVNANIARVVFVPKAANIVPNTWQTWNALNDADGDWYTSSFVANSPCRVGTADPGCTRAMLLSMYSDATIDTRAISGISLGFVGVKQSASVNTGFVDALQVGTNTVNTVYNFEREPTANVGIQVTANRSTMLAGTTLIYTLHISNSGNLTATSVVVTNALPSEVMLVNSTVITPSGSITCATLDTGCLLGDLAPGASATVIITPTTPISTGVIINTAGITASNDTVTSNNFASLSTTVLSSYRYILVNTRRLAPSNW